MNIIIEINDTLPERITSAIEATREVLLRYLKANPETDSLPCLNNKLDYDGTIQEIVDSSVPINSREIDTCFYLHKSELTEAFENNMWIAGCPMPFDAKVAILYYIKEEVQKWYDGYADAIFRDWLKNEEPEKCE